MKHNVVQRLVQFEAILIGHKLCPCQMQLIREAMQQWLGETSQVSGSQNCANCLQQIFVIFEVPILWDDEEEAATALWYSSAVVLYTTQYHIVL
jgi:hypothetical protein